MINRDTRRKIKSMNAAQLNAWIETYGQEMYRDGMRDSFMSLLLKLHDEFGFGNQRIERLLELSDTWLQGIHEQDNDIDAEAIRNQLISEGITCLSKKNITL